MALETGRPSLPDLKLLWTRLKLQDQEQVLSPEDRKAKEIREICRTLVKSATYLLSNSRVQEDPQFKDDVILDCVDDQYRLTQKGVTEELHLTKDLSVLETALGAARYAGSFLLAADFVKVTTEADVRFQIRQHMDSVIIPPQGRIETIIVTSNMTPDIVRAYKNWSSIKARINRASSLLALGLK